MVAATPTAGATKQGCSVNKTGRVVATLITLLITSTQVAAQKIYKCKGQDGRTEPPRLSWRLFGLSHAAIAAGLASSR